MSQPRALRRHPFCRRSTYSPTPGRGCRHCGLVAAYRDARQAQRDRLSWDLDAGGEDARVALAGDGGAVTFRGWLCGGGWDAWRLAPPEDVYTA